MKAEVLALDHIVALALLPTRADEARAAAPLRFHEKIASTPDLGGKKTRRGLVGVRHGDQKYPLSGEKHLLKNSDSVAILTTPL